MSEQHKLRMPQKPCQKKDKKLTDHPKWVSSVYTVVDTIRDCIINEFGVTPTVDAFASKYNRRFKRYWCKKVDAFSRSWSSEALLWINGPFEHYNRVVDKIVTERAKAIVICPVWQRMKWWKRIQLITKASYMLPSGVKIFQNNVGKPLRPRSWRTVALLVDGSYTREQISPVVLLHETKKDDEETVTENKPCEGGSSQCGMDVTQTHVHYHYHYHIS